MSRETVAWVEQDDAPDRTPQLHTEFAEFEQLSNQKGVQSCYSEVRGIQVRSNLRRKTARQLRVSRLHVEHDISCQEFEAVDVKACLCPEDARKWAEGQISVLRR